MAAELVPTGLPYGERQATEATRRQFGVPVDSPTQVPGPPPTLPAQGAHSTGGGLGFDPLTELGPIGMDQATQFPSFRQRLIEAAATSPNAGFRDAARRIIEASLP